MLLWFFRRREPYRERVNQFAEAAIADHGEKAWYLVTERVRDMTKSNSYRRFHWHVGR